MSIFSTSRHCVLALFLSFPGWSQLAPVDEQGAFKIVFAGDGETGKTTLVKRHLTGEYTSGYEATVGVEVHRMNFFTSVGKVALNVWDTAGQERFGSLREGY